MLFFIILILSLITSFVLPWWIVPVLSFLAALWIGRGPAHAFWSAFAAIFIVWAVMALFKSVPNNHILATRVAHLFHLPYWWLLLLVTALIGGLVSGMAAWSGLLIQKAFTNRQTQL